MVTLLPSQRVDAIYKSGRYACALKRLEEAERERKFCRHDLKHFTDVARIAALLNAEFSAGCPADEIYAAALLHDIGRAEHTADHAKASARFAGEILPECGFESEETERIIRAILAHGEKQEDISIQTARERAKGSGALSALILCADKLSRNCFDCAARGECYWKKKTERIWI